MSIIRQFWIGLIAVLLSIAVAVTITVAFGPLFGAWDWQATSFILLSAATLVLLMLDGSSHNDDRPTARVMPGAAHLAALNDLDRMTDAQMYLGSSDSPPYRSATPISATGWIRQALVTGLAALVFLVLLLV